MAGILKCHTGYKISWKIDDFKFLHKSVPANLNSPQIIESGHFIMWDCNWKFTLTLEAKPRNNSIIMVSIYLQVLDDKSWDDKGLSIAASLDIFHKGGDKSENKNYSFPTPWKIKDYKIKYPQVFSITSNERIRHDFDFTWTIWQEVSSGQFKHHFSNAKRFKLMANKWGLMLDDEESHDVKIRCQGVEMTAHKLVLSGSSSIFKAMFKADMKETRESQVEVTVGTPEAVKVMLRWIYTREIGEKEPQALELLKLAHYYDLADLMEECQMILVDTLCKENVIQMLNEADLLSAKMLKDSAIQFIIRNKSDFKEDLKTKLKQDLVVELFLAQ